MIGASALDTSVLSGKKMINMDSEEDDVLTISCAGGEDFIITAKPDTKATRGLAVVLSVEGLQGGHSGVEIDKGRINSNILAGRILRELSLCTDFDII
jgi:dipeptidase D